MLRFMGWQSRTLLSNWTELNLTFSAQNLVAVWNNALGFCNLTDFLRERKCGPYYIILNLRLK